MSNPSSADQSRTSTPNPNAAASRFTSQNTTAEDLLKSQTVGLVHLSDFRKRRAEALELKAREEQERSLGRSPGPPAPGTPGEGGATPQPVKKKRKKVPKGKLSFAFDDEEDGELAETSAAPSPRRSNTPDERKKDVSEDDTATAAPLKKRLGPNSGVTVTPKAMTKSILLREAQTREQLRKEFLVMQAAVKATEIAIPFVFYDGTNTPGGVCRMKKGEQVWLFLDKARKTGARRKVGGERSQREWARVGVDDLVLVRGEIIIPHHYDFYYFIVNKTIGFDGQLFKYSAQPTAASPVIAEEDEDAAIADPLARADKSKEKSSVKVEELEGYHDEPTLTKVVDRRWYERNKHIFPASLWEEFDPGKDYSKGIRKDPSGNAFFFS